MSKRIKKSWFVAGAALLAAGITASVAMRPTANLGLEASAVAAPAAGTPVELRTSGLDGRLSPALGLSVYPSRRL